MMEGKARMSEIANRLRDRATERRRTGWELSDAMTPGEMEAAAAEIDRLQTRVTELAQFERDARRYRYLRERDLDTIHKGGIFAGCVPENVVVNGDDLDAAIDTAMTTNT